MHTLSSVPRLARHALLVGGSTAMLAACDGGSSMPDGNASVRMASPAVSGESTASAAGLSISGSNGILELTGIRIVVDEFELSPVSSSDDMSCRERRESRRSDDDCDEFEANLFVADVPLASGAVTVASDRIREGTYGKLEFEVDDLFLDDDDDGDDDGDDAARAATIRQLLATLRQSHPDWPAGASMMIEGQFTPTGGDARAFRVYFDAEVEVEQRLVPPLTIDGSSAGVTIELRPDLWFRRGADQVRDLSALDYATTGRLVELEVEFERGVQVKVGR